jgi:Domain of unknown function (DUF4926)
VRLLDVVELAVDIPEYGLVSGATGTIVDEYSDPVGYEVEFVDDGGQTVALVPLRPEQLRVRPG